MPSVDPALVALLCCPQTQQPLTLAAPGLLAQVNCEGWLPEGTPPLLEGLVRADGRVLFPVRDGIPILLLEESIPLSPAG